MFWLVRVYALMPAVINLGLSLARYRMCADKYPFDGESIYQLYDNIAKADFTIPDHFSQRLKTLIKGLSVCLLTIACSLFHSSCS